MSTKVKKLRVTMVGALPPLKGNAYYCMSLGKKMSEKIPTQFISFRKLYPNFLYPGGVEDKDPKFEIKDEKHLKIHLLQYTTMVFQ